ncbi:MAG: hypothetical protein MHM6MM_000964 [Cercozoa sp. M6MM]
MSNDNSKSTQEQAPEEEEFALEDDEFEEFEEAEWRQDKQFGGTEEAQSLWNAQWDDDDIDEGIKAKLAAEIAKHAPAPSS